MHIATIKFKPDLAKFVYDLHYVAQTNKFDLGMGRSWTAMIVLEARRVTEFNKAVLFHFEKHYGRLLKYCKSMDIPLPSLIDGKQLENFLSQYVLKTGYKNACIQVIVSRGFSIDGQSSEDLPHLVVAIWPFDYGSKKPLRLDIESELIRSWPNVKSTCDYGKALARISQLKKSKNKLDSFVYWDERMGIKEEAFSNLFLVKNLPKRCLYTPRDGILPGVTREIVIELASKHQEIFPGGVIEKRIHLDELLSYDEAFVTATRKGIAEVELISGFNMNFFFKTGEGTATTRLKEMFSSYREKYFLSRVE